MLFKINVVLFRVAIFLCIIYCSGSLMTAYNKLDKKTYDAYNTYNTYSNDNILVTQANFQPIFINLWGINQ